MARIPFHPWGSCSILVAIQNPTWGGTRCAPQTPNITTAAPTINLLRLDIRLLGDAAVVFSLRGLRRHRAGPAHSFSANQQSTIVGTVAVSQFGPHICPASLCGVHCRVLESGESGCLRERNLWSRCSEPRPVDVLPETVLRGTRRTWIPEGPGHPDP